MFLTSCQVWTGKSLAWTRGWRERLCASPMLGDLRRAVGWNCQNREGLPHAAPPLYMYKRNKHAMLVLQCVQRLTTLTHVKVYKMYQRDHVQDKLLLQQLYCKGMLHASQSNDLGSLFLNLCSVCHVYEVRNTASDRYSSILEFPAPRMPFLGAELPKGCSPVEGERDHCQKAKWLVV